MKFRKATGIKRMNADLRRILGSTVISAALAASLGLCATLSLGAERAPPGDAPTTKMAVVPEPTESPRYLKDEHQITSGTVLIAGRPIGYQAEAGILVVHVKDPLDDDPPPPRDEKGGPPPPQPAEAGMSYVAYFRGDKEDSRRPITFLYNGGPGSSTVWLHMGAFGPKRVVTADDSHTPAAPYPVVNNEYSLLDVSDLVFVDAPGTGFSRIAGKDREKAFYGIDQDAWAFSDFIVQFLAKYGRWTSPKFLFGESYGTQRSAVLANLLETERDVDFNGVILLSQILHFSLDSDVPEANPGVDIAYQLNLPTYAASAWYHHKLPGAHTDLAPLLT